MEWKCVLWVSSSQKKKSSVVQPVGVNYLILGALQCDYCAAEATHCSALLYRFVEEIERYWFK